MHRGDHLELLGGQEKRKAEARGFVLEFGPVARLVTYLAQAYSKPLFSAVCASFLLYS